MSTENSTSLRDMLESNIEAANEGTLGQVKEAAPIEINETPDQTAETPAEARSRDEQGRFAAKAKQEEEARAAEAEKVETIPQLTAENAVNAQPAAQRPTTWKKEYLPIWDKIQAGTPLNPDESKKLAAYSVQREREYATGVSTYRQEAQNAKHLQEALMPFVPTMQKQNMNAVDFIKNLGTTYHFLVEGSPQQKLQAIAKLANDVGVPLNAVAQTQQGQQVDPVIPQLMQYIQNLEHKVNSVTGWREQQDERDVHSQISRFENSSEFPHFQAVRGTMGRLLETGFAQDLDTAYAMATRMNPDLQQNEIQRQVDTSAPVVPSVDKAAVAAKAKANAVSVRSVTPTGTTKPVDAKDLRGGLMSAFNSLESNRV